jgi:cell division protein FtsQ
MPALKKTSATRSKTHAARKPAGTKNKRKTSRKKSSRKKKLNIFQRARLTVTDWRETILGYKAYAYIGAALIVVLTGYIALAAGAGAWLRDEVDDAMRTALVASGLSVEQIRVEGRNRAALDEVRGAIGVIQGESILHYDIEAARARLEAIEWVEDVQVIRFLPKTIHVVLRERSPVAIWQMDGELHLVDNTGFVINEFEDVITNDPSAMDLPLIVGPGAPAHATDLFQVLQLYPDLAENFASAIRIADRRWNVRLKNGIEIRLPAENIDLALSRIVKYDAEHDLLRQEIQSVDLRLPDRVYLKLTDEEAERLWSPRPVRMKTRT